MWSAGQNNWFKKKEKTMKLYIKIMALLLIATCLPGLSGIACKTATGCRGQYKIGRRRTHSFYDARQRRYYASVCALLVLRQ
jgi:hypothetical protein